LLSFARLFLAALPQLAFLF